MKKFMLAAVAVLAMSAFMSCDNSSKADANETDSTEVVVDSLATDSINVDSLAVGSDSCSCK